nr:ferrous iron transport protein A [candidate division Zixibacteria bacterium]
MSLNELKPGQMGRITRVAGIGPIRRRLLDLGIHPGETITMVKSAPLRDPLEVSLGNGHISICRSEAALITIEVIS